MSTEKPRGLTAYESETLASARRAVGGEWDAYSPHGARLRATKRLAARGLLAEYPELIVCECELCWRDERMRVGWVPVEREEAT